MSIKIKTLKRFLLIFVCFIFAGINYFNYVQADDNDISTATQSTSSGLTDTLSSDFQAFLNSKNGQDIKLSDLSAFSANEAATKIGDKNVFATFDDLPAVDKSEIKVMSQKYQGLSAEKKQAQIETDDYAYLSKIAYIIFSNLPKQIFSASDASALKDEFFSNLVDLNKDNNADALAYFGNIGDRMNLVLSQTKDIEVPENMVGIYTKALRLARGFSTLKEDGKNFDDSISRVIMLKKITNLATLTDNFSKNDVSPFVKEFLPSIK